VDLRIFAVAGASGISSLHLEAVDTSRPDALEAACLILGSTQVDRVCGCTPSDLAMSVGSVGSVGSSLGQRLAPLLGLLAAEISRFVMLDNRIRKNIRVKQKGIERQMF
jgi:hypothetical protein